MLEHIGDCIHEFSLKALPWAEVNHSGLGGLSGLPLGAEKASNEKRVCTWPDGMEPTAVKEQDSDLRFLTFDVSPPAPDQLFVVDEYFAEGSDHSGSAQIDRSSSDSGSHVEEGDGWRAVFNRDVPRVLDVDLVHTLSHDNQVNCVRFSADGKYVATGCNQSAQIFDVINGEKVCVFQDDTVHPYEKKIDVVCFSPDGMFLVTGGSDKFIRVCWVPIFSSKDAVLT